MYQELRRIDFSKVRKTIALFSALFLGFYAFFNITYNPVHNFYPTVEKDKIIVLQHQGITKDGIEVEIMLIGTFIFFLISYFAYIKINKFSFFDNVFLQLFFILPTLYIFYQVKSVIFSPLPDFISNLALVLGEIILISLTFLIYFYIKKKFVLSTLIFLVLWAVLVMILILGMDKPSIYDYGFFLGPALKLSQGEPLKSFYMQYGLFQTYFFKWMVDLGLKAYHMQFGLVLILFIWFVFYYKLASKLIKNKLIVLAFMVSLLYIKYFAITPDATSFPQVLPTRLDLWVPLFLILYKFGFKSIISALSFCLVYLLVDNFFGFFYLGLYFLFLFFEIWKDKLPKGFLVRLWSKKYLFLLFFFSFLLENYLIGGFISPAAKFYKGVQLGLDPIQLTSPFWIILALIPYLLIVNLINNRKRLHLYLFLFGLIIIQLIYFFGRSVDNNLLNIAGIILFILFMAFDRLINPYKLYKTTVILVSLFLIATSLLLADNSAVKADQILNTITSFKLDNKAEVEEFIDKHPDFLKAYQNQNLVILSKNDSYLNYRYHLKQIGFFAPFAIHVYVDETADFLVNLLRQNYKVIFWEDDISQLIEQLDNSKEIIAQNKQIDYIDKGNLYELVLKNGSSPADLNLKPLWVRLNINNQVSLSYPKSWRVGQLEGGVTLKDPENIYSMLFIVTKKPQNSSLEDFDKSLTDNKNQFHILNLAKFQIKSLDRIYSRTVNKFDAIADQFILIKGGNIIEVIIWPIKIDADRPAMESRLTEIFNTIEIR